VANFAVYRFRRGDDRREFVGHYRYKLRRENGALKIAERRSIFDSEELGTLGAVSFILECSTALTPCSTSGFAACTGSILLYSPPPPCRLCRLGPGG